MLVSFPLAHSAPSKVRKRALHTIAVAVCKARVSANSPNVVWCVRVQEHTSHVHTTPNRDTRARPERERASYTGQQASLQAALGLLEQHYNTCAALR